jgi:hypothetical protein
MATQSPTAKVFESKKLFVVVIVTVLPVSEALAIELYGARSNVVVFPVNVPSVR